METTIELPDDLVAEIKRRAVREGREVNDAIADIVRKGIDISANTDRDSLAAVIATDAKTGLPFVVPQFPADPLRALSPEEAAEILLQQEVMWHDDAGG